MSGRRFNAEHAGGPSPKGLWERLRTPRHVLMYQAMSEAERKEHQEDPSHLLKEPARGLEGARYPITSKGALMRALGGKGVPVVLKGAPPMLAEEAADLCFAERRKFDSPRDVLMVLKGTSWARGVTRALHMALFPLLGPTVLIKRAGNIRVEGVSVGTLSADLNYPIGNTTQLLESLAEARARIGVGRSQP